MSDQTKNPVPSVITTKTFVRGTYLFSTDDGTGYQEKNKNRVEQEIIIEDKGNLGELKKQLQSKKQQILKKKQKAKKQKQVLIPIRQTPVQPLPEPQMDNNKCQRATQQQFQYFQTYISQKQKQRKFQEEENRKIEFFEKQQEKFRNNEENQERKNINIVFEKDDPLKSGLIKNLPKKKGPTIKVVIKKKNESQLFRKEQVKSQKIYKSQRQQQKLIKENLIDGQQKQKNQEEQGDYQRKTKVRVIQKEQQ